MEKVDTNNKISTFQSVNELIRDWMDGVRERETSRQRDNSFFLFFLQID